MTLDSRVPDPTISDVPDNEEPPDAEPEEPELPLRPETGPEPSLEE